MKQLPLCLATAIALAVGFTACDDSASMSMPGSSLVEDQFSIVITDTFKIYSKSVLNPKVQSRTTTQLLGAIDAPTYGTLRADYIAQLFPTTSIDTTGVELDSVKLQLVFEKNGFIGDSLAPIGFEVYPLSVELPYPIYSNFPAGTEFASTGFYNPTPGADDCHGRGIFTAGGLSISEETAGSSYRFAYANLPLGFGQKIYDAFRNPSTRQMFNNPDEFVSNIFPGIYVKATYGSGRVTRITDTRLLVYYTKTERLPNSAGVMIDSVRHLFTYYMSTAPEVVSNTNISLEMSDNITRMADEERRSVILSPAGRDVELYFPIQNIIKAYDKSTGSSLSMINTMSFEIACDSIANGRGITPPAYLLMVLKKDKDKFFAANKLPDDVTSFVATFNQSTMTYSFGNMRSYLTEMIAKGDAITAEDFTFTITPVSMVSEDSSSYYASSGSTLSGLSPMVAMPSMVELLPKDAKVTLTFSKQQLK